MHSSINMQCDILYGLIQKKMQEHMEKKEFFCRQLTITSVAVLYKHTLQSSCCSHQCRSWSRCGGICPCKTPPRWWQTWRWRRRAAGRSGAGEPWLSWWTSTPPGDLRERPSEERESYHIHTLHTPPKVYFNTLSTIMLLSMNRIDQGTPTFFSSESEKTMAESYKCFVILILRLRPREICYDIDQCVT